MVRLPMIGAGKELNIHKIKNQSSILCNWQELVHNFFLLMMLEMLNVLGL